MRRMKQDALTCFCLALLIGMSVSQAAAQGATTTLKATFTTSQQPAWSKIIENFQDKHPNIKIQPSFVPFDLYDKVLSTQFQAGNAPDVLYTPLGGSATALRPLARAGYLAELGSAEWVSRIPAFARRFVEIDGKIYGWPNAVSPTFIMYNLDKFNELGLKVPTSASEFLDLCKKIRDAGVTPIALGGLGFSYDTLNLLAALTAPYVEAPDPKWIEKRANGQVSFAGDPGYQRAVDQLLAMNKAGCFDKGVAGMTRAAALGQFVRGDAVMYLLQSLQVGTVRQANPKFAWSLFAPPPEKGFEPAASMIADAAIVVNVKTQNLAAATAFVDFVASPEQSRVFNEVNGTIAPNQFIKKELPEYLKPLQPIVDADRVAMGAILDMPLPTIAALGTSAGGLYTGQTSTQGLLTKLDESWPKQAK